MMLYPGETWEEYKARYRESCAVLRDKLYMGTTAWGGRLDNEYDISRDEEDYFIAWEDGGENHVGNWVTGFGFINVRFPKATSRPVTDDEFEWFLDNPTTMG